MKLKTILEEILPNLSKKEQKKLANLLRLSSKGDKVKALKRINTVRRSEGKKELTFDDLKFELSNFPGRETIDSLTYGPSMEARRKAREEKKSDVMSKDEFDAKMKTLTRGETSIPFQREKPMEKQYYIIKDGKQVPVSKEEYEAYKKNSKKKYMTPDAYKTMIKRDKKEFKKKRNSSSQTWYDDAKGSDFK